MIRDHDGKFGWYQIDRGLSLIGIAGVDAALAMGALVESGLVVADGDMQKASTHYSITDKGVAVLLR